MIKTLPLSSLILLILLLSCSKIDLPKDYENGSEITVTGNVIIKIKEPQGAIQEVCDNAQTYELCNDLNTKFREGYKEDCCTNYNLCC